MQKLFPIIITLGKKEKQYNGRKDMDDVFRLISWKNRIEDNTISTISVSGDRFDIDVKVKNVITMALDNRHRGEFPFDWTEFGKAGDYITVEDIKQI